MSVKQSWTPGCGGSIDDLEKWPGISVDLSPKKRSWWRRLIDWYRS